MSVSKCITVITNSNNTPIYRGVLEIGKCRDKSGFYLFTLCMLSPIWGKEIVAVKLIHSHSTRQARYLGRKGYLEIGNEQDSQVSHGGGMAD